MRRGAQRGAMRRGAGGAVRLEVSWGPPLEGCAVDELRLVTVPRRGASPGASLGDAQDVELHVTSTAWVGGQKARFKWVCVRRGGGGGGASGAEACLEGMPGMAEGELSSALA